MWPICQTRTTTANPLLVKAFNETLFRRIVENDKILEKNNFIDLTMKLEPPENYLIYVTLPSVIGKQNQIFKHFRSERGQTRAENLCWILRHGSHFGQF